MAVCAWITVPLTVPVTLQTFAVFTVVGLLGTKRGVTAVLVYILLGAVGVPVFSGGRGGLGILFGNTGGYIIGFVFSALCTGMLVKRFGKTYLVLFAGMVSGLLLCYAFGTAWFMYLYTSNTGSVTLMTVLTWCVFPFIVPDLIKIAVSATVVRRVSPHIN